LPAPAQDINQDLHPLIFNPVAPEDNEGIDGLEQGQEIHLLQPPGEVFILNPPLNIPEQPDQFVEAANQLVEEPQMQIPVVHFEPPVLPASPVASSKDEIPYDQLLGSQQDSSGDQSQQME
jgi:hypothetical protein